MKEESHQVQLAALQKNIEILTQKTNAIPSPAFDQEKKKRSSKRKSKTKQVQVEDVNKNSHQSRYEDQELPVLEQALEELLSNSKDENPPIVYSQSEVEEFYTRLGCDSESVQVQCPFNDCVLIYDY